MNGVQPNNEINNINFINNDINNIDEPKYDTFVVIRSPTSGERFQINCNTKDKLKDVVQKYRLQSGDDKSDKFIYNAAVLDLEKTIEECGIKTGNRIVCIAPVIIGWIFIQNSKYLI